MSSHSAWRNSRLFMLLGVVVVVASNMRPWAKVVVTEEMSPQLSMTFSGRDVEVMPSALALVVIASILILGYLRGISLRIVQVIVAIASLGIVWFSLNGHDVSFKVNELVAASVGRTIDAMTTTTYAWWMGSVLGGVLVLVGAGFGLISQPPVRQSRYERAGSEHDLTPWQALDAGIDPTTSEPAK